MTTPSDERCRYVFSQYDPRSEQICICDRPIRYVSFFHDTHTEITFAVGKRCIGSLPFVSSSMVEDALKDQMSLRQSHARRRKSVVDRPPTPFPRTRCES
jgi:hypothetical protein